MAGSGCGDPCNNPIHYPNKINQSHTSCDCIDASNICYSGPELVCIGSPTNSKLEDILLKIDTQICSVIGDYSTYNFNCLTPVNTEAEFVDEITSYVCTLRADLNSFTSSTFPSTINSLQTQINQIVNPNLTLCTYSGITTSDTYTSIITKLANKVCDLNTRLNLSSVNWSGCYTVTTPPTTLPQAFQLLSDQICLAAGTGGGTVLPTFNNQGSCLPTPGTADTLVQTINKIKTRLCQTGVYDIDSSPWGCITNPANGTGPNIQAAIDAILPVVNTLKGNTYSFDGNQFNLNQTIPGDPCSGFTVSLDPSVGIEDRLVAATSTDTTPGTLQDKLEAGTNVTISFADPAKAVINSTFTDQKVKVNNSDPSAGFLEDKVLGISVPAQGISISTATVSNKVQFTPNIDFSTFGAAFFNYIQSDITLYNQFCNLACGCAPCNSSTTTTTNMPPTTLRMYIENQSTTLDANLRVTLNQNNPTVGFIDNGFNLAINGATSTGYFNLTTSNSPKTVDLTLSNPDYGARSYNINVEVRQGSSGPLVPGATTYSTTNLNNYHNTTFNIGSLSGDIVIKVTISNVIIP